ncbi:MCE family protein [Mycobacterium syngnathidarum]|uniref:Mammalian cell entry protein n=1 Tax=Mycobacterium syngnathidarum TaxID=1908205 RepID=A0A1Q9WHP1_9MYCO|nr:MCE family protein [Mycobacterium syngnathidarum]OHU07235.1 mammalian cell entry protein [Mycobacterium syngnathidarum]OLT98323.1 mammalian cell entry protein [Mycobacterium syngnathidarum]
MNGHRRLVVAAVLITVLAIVGAVGWKLLAHRDRSITVTAQFDSAAGLYVGNVVAVLGIPVGQVTRVTARGSYAEVDFTVDEGVAIPADVEAVTLSTSILTDRQIELSPPYRGGPTLRNGDIIGLHRTKTPVEFDRVLGMLDKLSTSLRGNGMGGGPVADLQNAGDGVIAGQGEQIKGALDELSRALRLSSDGGARTRQQVTTIITNLDSLLDAAAGNDAKLREFGSVVRQLSDVLAAEDFGSGTTGRQLNEVVEQTGQILSANREVIKQGIANGDTSVQTLHDRQRELAEFFDVLPLMADNLYNSIDQRNGAIRAHFLADRMVFDGQMAKEVCNMMGLRQLGCSTGTLQDYGPDFGLTNMLEGLAAMGQK